MVYLRVVAIVFKMRHGTVGWSLSLAASDLNSCTAEIRLFMQIQASCAVEKLLMCALCMGAPCVHAESAMWLWHL